MKIIIYCAKLQFQRIVFIMHLVQKTARAFILINGDPFLERIRSVSGQSCQSPGFSDSDFILQILFNQLYLKDWINLTLSGHRNTPK